MPFEDLPENWDDRPLAENNLADVVDLLFMVRDRVCDSVLIVMSDTDGMPIKRPIVIDGMTWSEPPPTSPEDMGAAFSEFRSSGARAALVAFGHRQPGVTVDDLRWRQYWARVLDVAGLEELGWFTADREQVTPIPASADAFTEPFDDVGDVDDRQSA